MTLLLLPLAAPALALPHDLMPAPVSVRLGDGELAIDASFTSATAPPCDERVSAGLARLVEAFSQRSGAALPAPSSEATGARLTVECVAAGAPVQQVGEDESYSLEVSPSGARLRAATSLGALHGLETLRQLVRGEDADASLPAVSIEDRPRFPWRGLLLDACRHFMPVEVVERTLDGMAAVKLNVLHWHLTEDQGFRVESRRFPRLHELGSDGLFYTQEQIRDVIAYARDRGIRVVPEFDIPGHATAWLVGHPELATLPGPYEIERRWGIHDPVLDPSREETYTFLDAFLGEMAELFPDAYVHIGGDEVTPRHWNESSRVRTYLYEHGLRDNEALQAHFNARVEALLAAHGKAAIGWDEVLHEDLPRTTVVQSWRGAESLAAAARRGFSTMLSSGWYLDHMQTAAFHYAVDPLPEGLELSTEERARVLGGEACMWSEFVTPETIDSRIWPRAAAIAERLWSPAAVRDIGDMYRRLEITSARLEERGLLHRANFEPMLRRLAGGEASEPLRRLAEVVEPVKLYRRGQSRNYTQQTPLDRLVDAARPESDQARSFRNDVEGWLAGAPDFGPTASLREPLSLWAANHVALDPLLARHDALAEARPLSRNLSRLAALALAALEYLENRRAPDAEWHAEAGEVLADTSGALAEVEIAVQRPVRLLVAAAASLDRLADLGLAAWLAELEAAAATAPAPSH
ncbi:MAG TPA: family 20 glycosylhydrolase [Thermoanaerobaculia bacterium]|nr:family 20 glycosylhydrolase [Thermoanaerobaculia bacterium]